MQPPIRLGISTCPNDTFAFHALLHNAVDTEGLSFEIELLDVEQLNQRMASGRFDVAKLSFATLLAHSDELVLMPAGAALGFGVGPVVLKRPGFTPSDLAQATVLAPGEGTTASLLWRLFHPATAQLEQRVFHEIMPALERGEADLGICIHEGRFSYADAGLGLFEDLGATWEAATSAPLPLGAIAGRRSLGPETLAKVARSIRRSVEWARAQPQATAATMQRYAQEQSTEAHFQHVELYVNDWTVDLGPEGRRAIDTMERLARERGLLPGSQPLEIQAV